MDYDKIYLYIDEIIKKYFDTDEKISLVKKLGSLNDNYNIHIKSFNSLNILNGINDFLRINEIREKGIIDSEEYIIKCVVKYFNENSLLISDEILVIITKTLCLKILDNYEEKLVRKIKYRYF